MGGRYTVCLVVAHALLITWGYAVTAHTDVVSQTEHAAAQLPGRAHGDRRRAAARRGRRRSRPGPRGGGCATRPGTSCTSTPTSPSRWRSATSSPTGADFIDNRPARVAVVAAVPRRRRRDPLVPVRRAGPAGVAAPDAGAARSTPRRPAWCRVVRHRSAPGRARRAGRAVLPVALPDPRAVVGAPTRTRCPPRRCPIGCASPSKDLGDHSAGTGPAAARARGSSPRARTAR